MVAIAQLVESWIVIPVVESSSLSSHPIPFCAEVAKLVDAPDLGSGAFGVWVRVPPSAVSTRFILHFSCYIVHYRA